jgi:hypothetical protein
MAAGRVILVGCVKLKLERRAAAKDLYCSPLWKRRRRYAEGSGCPGLILSAKYGMLDPETRISPYDLALGDLSALERRAWGERVVGELEDRFGSLAGTTLEVHAGAAYRRAIEPGVTERGGTVIAPVAGLGMGKQLAWYAVDR